MSEPRSGDPSAARRGPRARASDPQRTAVLEALDAAFTDGRLSSFEHFERTRTATRARFIDELRPLVADLRGADADLGLEDPEPEEPDSAPGSGSMPDAPPPGRPGRHRGFWTGFAVAIFAIVAGLAAIGFSTDSSPSDTTRFGPLFTTDGAEQMLMESRAEFGTEPIDSLLIYGDRAVLMQEDPTEPGKRLSQMFRGQWEETGFSARTDSPTFLISDVNSDEFVAALSTAAEELDTDVEQTGHVSINADVLGQPEYRVSVYEGDDITTVTVGSDGQVRKVS